jgi:hypothetical protein
MLHRPHDGDATRERRRAAQRRYRARQRSGRLVVQVEIDCDVISFLTEKTHWARDGDSARELGQAITRMLADTARRR